VVTEQGELYSVCCEAVFNQAADVRRTALVGIGTAPQQTPLIVVEPREPLQNLNENRRAEILEALIAAGRNNEQTRAITRFLFHPGFPVDIRHNAKINREELAIWAAEQIEKSSSTSAI